MNRGGVYIAIYDISVDRERNRAAKVLEGFGVRLQKSAFEVRLTKASRARLLTALSDLHMDSGWVALCRLDDKARRHHAGVVPQNPLSEDNHAYVL